MTVDQITEREAQLRAFASTRLICPVGFGVNPVAIAYGVRDGLVMRCEDCGFRFRVTFAMLERAQRRRQA